MSVLVVVTSAEEAGPLVRWGVRFARARRTSLAVLHVGPGPRVSEPKDVELVGEGGTPVTQAVREAVAATAVLFGAPDDTVELEAFPTRYRSSIPQYPLQTVLDEIAHAKANLVVVAKHEVRKGAARPWDLAPLLLDKAPCDTMLLRAGGVSGLRCDKILCPAAGGPHAKVALGLAHAMCHDDEAVMTALYVEPEAGEDARAVGMHQVVKVLGAARVPRDEKVRARVQLADSPVKGIRDVASEGFDLLVVGASNRAFDRRILFGTIDGELLGGPEGATAVAIVRRARPANERLREAFETWLRNKVPQLEREDRIDLFERLQNGSTLSFDFMALICLATSIAALGLLANSAAVVIGAMLVAPLMTPMIGSGLGLVQGNVVMVREAARSIGIGFLAALTIGYVFGALAPGTGLTPECLARGAPSELDLVVALLSGFAGAYATARPNLVGALAGVAIAAALVPPIATAGISLARGEPLVGEGAALLFVTNLVAIVLGAAAALYAVGVRGSREQGRKRLWARRALLGLIFSITLLAFVLGSAFLSWLHPGDAPLRAALSEHLAGRAQITAITTREVDETVRVELHLQTSQQLDQVQTDALARVARQKLKKPVQLRVVTELVTRATAAQ